VTRAIGTATNAIKGQIENTADKVREVIKDHPLASLAVASVATAVTQATANRFIGSSAEFAESLNEGTYVTNIIVPAIRALLKNLPYGMSTFISTSERQSIASADRKRGSNDEGKTKLGRRPDIMFVMKDRGKKYELMYTECSRIWKTAQQ
ncbi:15529_t:CDS:2, partial [Entrophospora sp. SA101]